jgi:hypothetical protein
MPIVYVPYYMIDLDYRLLQWLDKHRGKTGFSFELLDEFDMNPIYLDRSFRRLGQQGLLKLNLEKGVIIEVELTAKAHRFLSEHILGEHSEKRR